MLNSRAQTPKALQVISYGREDRRHIAPKVNEQENGESIGEVNGEEPKLPSVAFEPEGELASSLLGNQN